ncbi:hypothetical protein Hanom_Chr01g00008601 [Helianthus anomalus]
MGNRVDSNCENCSVFSQFGPGIPSVSRSNDCSSGNPASKKKFPSIVDHKIENLMMKDNLFFFFFFL